MMVLARPETDLNRRSPEAGVTLVEILVVLAIIGGMASVLGLSVTGGARNADTLEREATLLAVRLERAADTAVLTGAPAGFVWDQQGYSFVAFQNGAWSAHPDGLLGTAHALDDRAELSVGGQLQGQYLLRADMIPSATEPDTSRPIPLQIAITGTTAERQLIFDGVTAHSVSGTDRGQP